MDFSKTKYCQAFIKLLFLPAFLLVTSCGNVDESSVTKEEVDSVLIKLVLDEGLTSLIEGDSSELKLNAVYENGSTSSINSSDLTWECDGPAVSVNADGLVTAEYPGEAKCTAFLETISITLDFLVSEKVIIIERLAISPQGPLILPLDSDLALTLSAYYSDGSRIPVVSDYVWECDGEAVNVNQDSFLSTENIGVTRCHVRWQQQTAELLVTVTDTPPIERRLSLTSLDHIRNSDVDISRYIDWVDSAVAGKPGYGFKAIDAVNMYYLTHDLKYINLAIEYVEAQVVAAEEKIAIGSAPKVSSDSYLKIGGYISDLAYTYSYGYELLTDSQKQRWKQYAEQAVWNVWNHKLAEWGGESFSWSGWGVDKPGNNYHFSFLKATMTWGLADNNESWLELLKDHKLPTLAEYFAQFEGGGSREGTGYGLAQGSLFTLYGIWKDSTGIDLASRSSHAKQTIDYWIHATTPTLDQFAPIGDQSRVSFPRLYDGHENLVHIATSINIDSEQAKRGKWWLENNSLEEIVYGFNLRSSLLPVEVSPKAPTQLVYHSLGAGHLFVRSSWEKDAVWLSAVAGIYDESHAHRDQGAFSLFKNEWLAVTQNIWSHSGIHQDTEVHNTLRFVIDGETARQNLHSESRMSYSIKDDVTTIEMELSPAYQSNYSISSWQRNIQFSTNNILVEDRCEVAEGVEAIWQINLPEQPVLLADGSIQSGNLLITPISPAAPEITIIDWIDVDDLEYARGHHKLELQGSDCNYQVQLDIVN